MSQSREIKVHNIDQGFDYSGLLQEGLIYGKSYSLELFDASINDEDINDEELNVIQWTYICIPETEITSKNKATSEPDTADITTEIASPIETDTISKSEINKPRTTNFKWKNGSSKSIQFTVNNLELCGSFIEISAYLDNQIESENVKDFVPNEKYRSENINGLNSLENKISIKVWIHYRFRWFNRQQLLIEIQERKKHPWKISQRSTSLCGMACIFYFLIEIDPVAYEILSLHLHQFGYAVHNSYFLKPNPLMLDVNPLKHSEYPKGMAYADWMTLASMRNMESRIGYTGKRSQVFSSINWPPIMTKLGKKFLGFKTVEFSIYSLVKSYIRDYFLKNQKLEILRDQIDKSYKDGFKILLLVDTALLYNKSTYSLKDYINYHWVVYEGGLELLNNDGIIEQNLDRVEQIKFNIFSWGEEPVYSRTSNGISKQAFTRNYYGFIRMK